MRKQMKPILFLVLLLLAVLSCTKTARVSLPSPDYFSTASLQSADSLVRVLEEEVDPTLLPDSVKADYWFLLTKAHLWQCRSLVNDSMINYTVRYYRKHNSPYLGNAYQLAILQLNWRVHNLEEADALFSYAISDLKLRKDTLLGSVVYICMHYNYDRSRYEKSKQYCRYLIDSFPEQKTFATYMLGLTFGRMGLEDSLMFYVDQSLDLAYQEGKSEQIRHIARNYAATLSVTKGKGEKALHILEEVRRRCPFSEYQYEETYGLAYLACGNLDSAEYYINKLKDLNSSSTSFRMLYQAVIRAKRDLPIQSTLPQLQDSLLFAADRAVRTEKERVYVQDLSRRKELLLKTDKAEQQKMFWGILAAVLAVTGVLIASYQRKLLRKERLIRKTSQQMQQYVTQLKENETIIQENEGLLQSLSGQLDEQEVVRLESKRLQEENIGLQQKISQYTRTLKANDVGKRFFAEMLIRQSGILNQLKLNPKYIDDGQWPEIVEEVNRLYNNFPCRLRADFSALTESDIQLCCLILLRFSTSTIAGLTGVSPASVTKRKQRIKERMSQSKPELWELVQSLETYLWHY